ncbi:MAG: extracellular solute-binding protein [Acidimicrobiia bacterium]|nr:extracellular solute-binding protein [Acidimicrobiia bacterium]
MLSASCSSGETRLVVAAGTTVVDSGFIDHVADAYEQAHPGVRISVVAEPTRLALELGREGAADVTLTHAPLQEQAFVDEGGAVAVREVFSSRFILAGPPSLEGSFAGFELPEVLREVAASGIRFVSRGDGSGTHDKEWQNWIEAGIDPRFDDWYLETGQGMGPTLLVADQREALVLVEIGAWIAASDSLALVDMQLDPGALDNPYTAMAMSSSKHQAAALDFVEWLVSPEGRLAISRANEDLFGAIIYAPATGG